MALFLRNPAGCIVLVETGPLEKEKPMKAHGSFHLLLQLDTQEHLTAHGLEDFWEAETDW